MNSKTKDPAGTRQRDGLFAVSAAIAATTQTEL